MPLLAACLAAWLALAAFAAIAALAWAPVLRAGRTGRWTLVAGFLLAAHLSFILRDIHLHPQNYVALLYSHGGTRARLQVWITDSLPTLFATTLPLLVGVLGILPSLLRTVRRRPLVSAIGALLVSAVVFAASVPPRGRANAGPNAILIIIESFRSDRLFTAVTPRLSRLAAEGTTFTRAYPDVARTTPSLVTLLTGRYGLSHGIRHEFPSRASRTAVGPTLPRVLRENGFQTSVVADYAADLLPRMDLGFDQVDTPDFTAETLKQRQTLETLPFLLPYISHPIALDYLPALRELPGLADPAWLARRARQHLAALSLHEKFFLAVFFSAAHYPYAGPAPYYRAFSAPGHDGSNTYEMSLSHDPNGESISETDIQQIRALYDGALLAVDEAAGRFIESIRSTALGSATTILVAGDHGENLLERGWLGHGDELWAEAGQRVPLIVLGPGIPQDRREDPVSLADVTPTLAAALHLSPGELGPTDGLDLLNATPPEDRLIYSETGPWLGARGQAAYQQQRIPYPGMPEFTRLDPDHDFERVVRPPYEPLLLSAKHRAIIKGDHRLVYIPLRSGPLFELYRISPGDSERITDDARARSLTRDLSDFLHGKGEIEWRGFMGLWPVELKNP